MIDDAERILDTHADVRESIESGVSPDRAETAVRQRSDLLRHRLATRADIGDVRVEIETPR